MIKALITFSKSRNDSQLITAVFINCVNLLFKAKLTVKTPSYGVRLSKLLTIESGFRGTKNNHLSFHYLAGGNDSSSSF